MSALSTLDYIIFVLVMIGGIFGAIKGFIEEVSQKFGYFAGFIVATMFTVALASFVMDKTGFPKWFASFIAYIILFMVGFILIKALGSMLESIFDTAKLSAVNNILGFILGLLETLIFIGVVETALSFQNLFNLTNLFNSSFVSSSIILPFFKTLLSWVQGLI